MRRYACIALKTLGGLALLLVTLVVVTAILLNTSMVQNRLLHYSTELLQDKLQTKVRIDSISINLLGNDVFLKGVDIEDRQGRKMLQADRLALDIDMMELFKRRINISKADFDGVRVQLHCPRDSAANYQFMLDAMKHDKPGQGQGKSGKKHELVFDVKALRLHNFHLTLDNHRPRKNVGKPHRGAFDAGHLDVTAHLELTLKRTGQDTHHLTLKKFECVDSVAGIHIKDLHFDAIVQKEKAQLQHVVIQHENTVLQFDSATIVLPSKKENRKLAYQTSLISGKTLLKDISKPFAPALAHFSVPLELKVRLSGTDSTMLFKDIHVNTTDKKLQIDAEGNAAHLKEKEDLAIRFHVKNMVTHVKTAKDIIDQFMVKKFMMKQLKNLQTIRYKGDFDILYKKERFRGLLHTSAGRMNFHFTLDEKTKYLSGHVNTTTFHLGRVIEMKDIDNVTLSANFCFDYSKARTAKIRKQVGGKLPIGRVDVENGEGNYKKIKIKNVSATIISDGAVAEGKIIQQNKLIDLLCNFTFTSTDTIHKMKIKPGLKWHHKKKEPKS